MAILENERELEDYIVTETEKGVNPITDETVSYCLRQVNLGGYGIIDIVFINIYDDPDNEPELYFRIIELKKGIIDNAAVAQISQYKQGIEHYLGLKDFQIKTRVEGILIGAGHNNNDNTCFLIDSIDWLSCYHYELTLEYGIQFKQSCGWVKKGEEFNNLDEITKQVREVTYNICKKYQIEKEQKAIK